MAIKCPSCHAENPDTKQFCGDCGTPLPLPKEHIPKGTETLQTPVHELSTGSTFAGRYQIIEELGRGGMGRVYRVLDKKLNEEVALKLIRPEISFDKEIIQRFSNELKLARKIGHRNVGKMYELMEDGGTHFITMEYVPGQDLRGLIRQSKCLAVGTAVAIAKQVCEGLAEAHILGVVHRDLKPQNIMIDKGGKVKIMDFGIARSLSGKGITGAGVMIGTPEYMSPEQVEGKEVDQRSDIYSLGVILYEMVTGRVPFEGDTPFTIGVKHKSEVPKDPRTLNAQLAEDLSRLILRCLEKAKEKRPQTTAEIITGLDRIEKGLPTTERVVPERKTPTSREITVKFTPKKLFIPALAIIAVIALAAVFLLRDRSPKFDPNLVAVADFVNQTGDSKLDSLGREAARWITEGLTRANLFAVAPLPSPEALQDQAKIKDPLRKLAVETGAGKVVSGAIHLQGDNIRFYADVRDMNSGKILQALAPVDGPRLNPNESLEIIRTKLMGTLACLFTPSISGYTSLMKQTPNFESFREFLEGLRCFARRDLSKSFEHFNQAASLDPTNSLALINMCSVLENVGYSTEDHKEYAESQALIDEIMKSKDKLSEGEILLLENVQAWINGDLEERHRTARKLAAMDSYFNFQLAMEARNNNYPREAVEAFGKARLVDEFWEELGWHWATVTNAYHMLGEFKNELNEARRARTERPESLSRLWYETRAFCGLGRMKDVNRLLDECTSLPPERRWSPGQIMFETGQDLRAHGFMKESVGVLERARQWYENRPQDEKASAANRYYLGQVFFYLERWPEAQVVFEKLNKDVPSNLDYLSYCGQLAAIAGDRDKALDISRQLDEKKPRYRSGASVAYRAQIAAWLGDKERAIALLRQAVSLGYYYLYIHGSMCWERLKDYPPFIQFVKPKG